MCIWQKHIFDEKIFFRSKKSKICKIFFDFSQNFWDLWNVDLKSQNVEKLFFQIFDFLDRKNIFSSKNIFSLFFHKICSILTKYEGITPKTPKVRLIFRFLTIMCTFFSFLGGFGADLVSNFWHGHLSLTNFWEKVQFQRNFWQKYAREFRKIQMSL